MGQLFNKFENYNEFRKKLVELVAENQVKEAEANAKIAVAKAKGKADALKIEADGEAYYNRTVALSLNSLLVQQYALEKWNGKLPNTNASNSIPFLNIK